MNHTNTVGTPPLCATCGRSTVMGTATLCDGCWEVEHRLADYLRTGGENARLRIGEALAAALRPRRSLIENAPDLDALAERTAAEIAAAGTIDAAFVFVSHMGRFGASISACKALSPAAVIEMARSGLEALAHKIGSAG